MGIAALAASAVACGSEHLVGGDASADRPEDTSGPADAHHDARDSASDGLTFPDGREDAADASADADALPPWDGPDVVIPPPHVFPFDACAPFPCEAGQFCAVDKAVATCIGLPGICEVDAACDCVVRGASWCAMPKCFDMGGEVVLRCKGGGPP